MIKQKMINMILKKWTINLDQKLAIGRGSSFLSRNFQLNFYISNSILRLKRFGREENLII